MKPHHYRLRFLELALPATLQLAALGALLALPADRASAADAPPAFSWQEPQARVLPEGDLEWAPRPFVFQPGPALRYIDFEKGSDDNAGTSKDAPWKHHPWDPQAGGQARACTGVHTYVFKRGTIYRGTLEASESGEPGNPIRLTSDPAWGEGEAALFGSERVAQPWKRCDATIAPGIPEPEKVWYVDLGNVLAPHCVWELRGDRILRVAIARTPNWTVTHPDDPAADWWQWTGPIGNPSFEGEDWWHLTQSDPRYYDGAYVWSDWSGNMGTPYASPVLGFDPARHSIRRGKDAGVFGEVKRGNRYFLENLPQFLDEPGEFYFAARGPVAGRLFIRLEDDRDPNQAVVEASRRERAINVLDRSHIAVSGLRFSFLEVPYSTPEPKVYHLPTAIQLTGDCRDVRISNCRFLHVAKAVQGAARIDANHRAMLPELPPRPTPDFMDDIAVTDCEIVEADHGGVMLFDGGCQWDAKAAPIGGLGRVEILRNRLDDIGIRPAEGVLNLPAIIVDSATLAEVAGNIVSHCWGVGIFMHGGKDRLDPRDRPLIRMLTHHNKVTDCLLASNDWGGIASWQGGPSYVFDNICGNPVGPKHDEVFLQTPGAKVTGEYTTNAYAYYLDGMYKSYIFNNIAWGRSNNLTQWDKNRSGCMMVIGFLNQWCNNTVYRFAYGMTGSAGQRTTIAGNVFDDMTSGFFQQDSSGDLSVRGGGVDMAKVGSLNAVSTLAYTNNVFFGHPLKFGQLGTIQAAALPAFRGPFSGQNPRAGDVGEMTETVPFAAAERGDFRPRAGGAVVDRGVRFFSPWGLYEVVGEWSFCRFAARPDVVIGENLFMSDEYVERSMYTDIPRNDLEAPGARLEDYADGPLEDWCPGTLVFDGKTRYCILRDRDLKSDYTVHAGLAPNGRDLAQGNFVYPGAKRRTVDMGTNNFLVEVYFRTEPGHAGSVLVSKQDAQAGYELALDDQGRPALTLRAGAATTKVASAAKANDGQWHHVLAEADRAARTLAIYLDGHKDGAALALPPDASLANSGDFLVGKGPAADARFFAGAMDFLRVARGTLADARTTIEELRAWQFDGPFLRDFAGHAPVGKRDAGALELVPAPPK